MARPSIAIAYGAVGAVASAEGTQLICSGDAHGGNGAFAALVGAIHFGLIGWLAVGTRRTSMVLVLGAGLAGALTALLVAAHMQGVSVRALGGSFGAVSILGAIGAIPVACAGAVLAAIESLVPRARPRSLLAWRGHGAVMATGAATIAVGTLISRAVGAVTKQESQWITQAATLCALLSLVAWERSAASVSRAIRRAESPIDLGIGETPTTRNPECVDYRNADPPRVRGRKELARSACARGLVLAAIASAISLFCALAACVEWSSRLSAFDVLTGTPPPLYPRHVSPG